MRHITETIYAATVPHFCMHHIMQFLGKGDILYDYLNITVDGTKFMKTLGPRYKLYFSRIFLLDDFAKYISNIETNKIIHNDIIEYAKLSDQPICSIDIKDESIDLIAFLIKVKNLSSIEDKKDFINLDENKAVVDVLNTFISNLITAYNKQYYLSYRLYKKTLNMIISSFEFQDSNNINLAKGMLFRTLNKYMLNRHDYVDGHYVLELLRIQYLGPTPEGHN